MEKRRWQRRPMRLDVEVRMWRRHGEQIVHCRTDDISMTGAFIRTNALGFPKRRLIEMRFAVLERLNLNKPVVLARVVHKGRNGLGVNFCRPDSNTIKALHRMLQWRSYYPVKKPAEKETTS